MSKKRHRSAETGEFVSPEEAKANPETTVAESVEGASIDIAELVWHLDPFDLAALRRIIANCGDFTNKAALQRAIDEALEGCNL